MSSRMNAVLLTGHGGPEKLVFARVPKPEPQAREVLISVSACSVNNTDLNTRTGWYDAEREHERLLQDRASARIRAATSWRNTPIRFPRIQGADIVGRVVETGSEVDCKLVGQRVIVDPWIRGETSDADAYVGSETDGGFAEFAVVPAANVYPVRSPLSDVQLACIPCAYSTAENMLVKGAVESTDTVAISGASGGVGCALIQLCRLRGATVIAITHNSKRAVVKKLGANHIYPRDEALADALARHDITVCLDTVGGSYFPLMITSLQAKGRYVSCGAIAGPLVELDLRGLIYKDLTMIGATRTENGVFRNLVSYIDRNLLRPLVAKTFLLSELHAAQKFFQSKNFCGKVVVTL